MTTPGIQNQARAQPGWTLIYDSDCGFCRWSLALVLRADRRRTLTPLALGTAEADDRLHDLRPEQRAASWHLIAPDGRRQSAGAAAPPLLTLLPGGRIPAAVLARAPALTDRSYRWIAGNRSRLSRLLPSGAKLRASRTIGERTAGRR
jgi:predicted DCC family thiol-disulfide oxidoreductase YuxK